MQGTTMKSLSLTKVSLFVATAITASFIVNANEKAEADVVKAKNATTEVVKKSDAVAFSSLDTNKDGELSLSEVKASNNKLLARTFSEIDSNSDNLLTQKELESYVASAQ